MTIEAEFTLEGTTQTFKGLSGWQKDVLDEIVANASSSSPVSAISDIEVTKKSKNVAIIRMKEEVLSDLSDTTRTAIDNAVGNKYSNASLVEVREV